MSQLRDLARTLAFAAVFALLVYFMTGAAGGALWTFAFILALALLDYLIRGRGRRARRE